MKSISKEERNFLEYMCNAELIKHLNLYSLSMRGDVYVLNENSFTPGTKEYDFERAYTSTILDLTDRNTKLFAQLENIPEYRREIMLLFHHFNLVADTSKTIIPHTLYRTTDKEDDIIESNLQVDIETALGMAIEMQPEYEMAVKEQKRKNFKVL